MLGPPLMSAVWYWSERGVRSPALVLEVTRENVVALCVLPPAASSAYIVRDVPYMREVIVYETTDLSRFRGYVPNTHTVECWQYMQDSEERPVAQQTASQDGYSMGLALRHVIGAGNATNQDVFALGRRYATMAGYQSADSAFDYIEGFVNGWEDGAPKEIEAPKAGE